MWIKQYSQANQLEIQTMKANRYRLIGVIALPVVASFFASPVKSEELGAATDKINEYDILKKMEMEIGGKIGVSDSASPQKKKTESEPQKKDPRDDKLYSATLHLRSGGSVTGSVFLAQKSITLLPDSSKSALSRVTRVDLAKIRKIELSNWRPDEILRLAGNRYYLPQSCRIETFEGEVFTGHCEMEEWLQVNLNTESELISLRTYYRGGDVASPSTSSGTPSSAKKLETAPPDDIISSIEFEQKKSDKAIQDETEKAL